MLPGNQSSIHSFQAPSTSWLGAPAVHPRVSPEPWRDSKLLETKDLWNIPFSPEISKNKLKPTTWWCPFRSTRYPLMTSQNAVPLSIQHIELEKCIVETCWNDNKLESRLIVLLVSQTLHKTQAIQCQHVQNVLEEQWAGHSGIFSHYFTSEVSLGIEAKHSTKLNHVCMSRNLANHQRLAHCNAKTPRIFRLSFRPLVWFEASRIVLVWHHLKHPKVPLGITRRHRIRQRKGASATVARGPQTKESKRVLPSIRILPPRDGLR